MELKYKYNRPRPHQLAEFYGLDVSKFELDSMKTPSYPSGHATQGYLMGKFYSDRHPEYNREFMELAEEILLNLTISYLSKALQIQSIALVFFDTHSFNVFKGKLKQIEK